MVEEEALGRLAQQGYRPEYGARHLSRVIETQITKTLGVEASAGLSRM